MGAMDGKVCVVTGAGGSLGLASARAMLREGAKVMLVDLEQDKLRQAAASLAQGDGIVTVAAKPENYSTHAADVSDTEATKAYLDATVDAFGKIDVIFSNAGMSGAIAPITEYPDEVFDRIMAVNVRASFLACKYGMPRMNDGGSIIITSSIMGVRSNPNIVGYSTSKHAVVGLARVVAKEGAGRNIRCNVVAPGPIDNTFQTDIEDRLSDVIGINATEMINQGIPLGRHASPDEIANVVLFLASDASSFCTAGVYMADGGLDA